MLSKRGIAVSPGVAISRAVVIDAEDHPVPRRMVGRDQVVAQIERVEAALQRSAEQIEQIKEQATAAVGAEHAKIFAFHVGMLQDEHLRSQFRRAIESEFVTAEYAVYSVMRQLAKTFRQQDNRYFRERVSDIWDLERRILGNLLGQTRKELTELQHEALVVAHDLTPSQTATLDPQRVKGLATDAGGLTSHTAILAHALGIPAVVGLKDITADVETGDTVIVDGNRGVVIVDPDAKTLLEYRQRRDRIAARATDLDERAQEPGRTKDGTKISLWANIEFPSEIPSALGKGAEGVGLYRTEFLFLSMEREPSEEQQYQAYKEAIAHLDGRPLVLRTLDLGADKLWPSDMSMPTQPNPFLGVRSIRLCLQNLPLFKRQLRAILRAGMHGPVKIMFPLISSIMELRQAKMILNDVKEDLHEHGVPYGRKIPVGMMVEVPSAAIQASTLSREVDFFSIGTNDLIQYTVAVDRSNERIASLYTGGHPAVLQLIRQVVRAADRAEIEVSLCGEMAGQPEFVMLLVGMGLRTLSMTPPAIPEVKRLLSAVSLEQCKRVARKASSFDSDREVQNYLREEVVRVAPKIFGGWGLEY